MAVEKIGDWTKDRLNRHIQATVLTTPATLPPSLQGDEVHSESLLKVGGDIDLSPQAVAKLKVYLGL